MKGSKLNDAILNVLDKVDEASTREITDMLQGEGSRQVLVTLRRMAKTGWIYPAYRKGTRVWRIAFLGRWLLGPSASEIEELMGNNNDNTN